MDSNNPFSISDEDDISLDDDIDELALYELQNKKVKIDEETTENLIMNIHMLNERINTLCNQIDTMCKKIKFYENLNEVTQSLPELHIATEKENHKKRSRPESKS